MGLFDKLLSGVSPKKEYVRYVSYAGFNGYKDDHVLYKILKTQLNIANTEFDYTNFNKPDYHFDLTIPENNEIYDELNKYVNDEAYIILPKVESAYEESNNINIKIGVYKKLSEIKPGSDNEALEKMIEGSKDINIDYVYETIPSYKIELTDNFAKNEYESECKLSSITSKTKFSKIKDFVVIDLETTGLRNSSGIVELSAIRFKNFVPIEKYETLINPKRKIPEEATRINNITDDMVKDKPTIDQASDSFIKFVGDENIVGHNLEFDLGILEYRGICFNGKRKFYDTLLIAQRNLKKARKKWDKEYECYDIDYNHDYDVEDYKLDTICEYYGINRYNAHRGGSDCLATGLLFKRFADEIADSDN